MSRGAAPLACQWKRRWQRTTITATSPPSPTPAYPPLPPFLILLSSPPPPALTCAPLNLMGGVQSAVVSGATGENLVLFNGIYDKVDERCGGYRLYVKRGDDKRVIEHFEGQWQVKPAVNKGKDGCWIRVEGGCKLRECTSRVWQMFDGKVWNDAPSVKVVAGEEAERKVRGGCLRARPHASPFPTATPPPPPLSPHLPLVFVTRVIFIADRRVYRRPFRGKRASCARVHQWRHRRKCCCDDRFFRADAGEGAGRPCAVRQARRCQRVHRALQRQLASQIS